MMMLRTVMIVRAVIVEEDKGEELQELV